MADVTCPECGQITTVPEIRKAFDEFCPHCDYPLFWVSAARTGVAVETTTDGTLRRLPGAGGRQRIGTKVCPHCGELNPLARTECLRCGDDLDPKPLPPPPPVVEVVAPPAPPPPPKNEPSWIIVAVCVVALMALVALTVIYLATR